MFFGGAVDSGGKAVPSKFPQPLDFDFGEARIFVPEE